MQTDLVTLVRSNAALARASRMVDDLARHAHDAGALHDRLPYVLDLLAAVTRMIDEESKGERTQEFGRWWSKVDRSAQEAIQTMRNAELKHLESTTMLDIETRTAVRAIDYPDMNVADGDTLTQISWLFKGGAFDGQPVFIVLRDYLHRMTELLEEAERRLAV